MKPVLYSHRLKNVLQLMVRDLGLVVALDDSQTELDLKENEATIREAASQIGVQIEIRSGTEGNTITFY